jgi:hypothetical protein
MPDLDIETLYYHPKTAKLEWRYKYCPKKYAINGGTRLIKLHLIVAHEISDYSPRQERLVRHQRTIEEAITFGQNNPRKRRYININPALDNSKLLFIYIILLIILI